MSVTDKLATTVGTIYKYLGKAIEARDKFYQGMDEAVLHKEPDERDIDAKFRWGTSVQGKELIAENKWQMEQSRTFALAAVASSVLQLVYEQRKTNELLKKILEKDNG